MVRSSLEWAAVDSELKSLLVTSCVKGEGKTLTISNLAVTLARSGNRVVIVDGDLRAPRLHTVFEMPNAVGLTSVVLGKAQLDDALRDVCAGAGLATDQVWAVCARAHGAGGAGGRRRHGQSPGAHLRAPSA